MKFEQETLESVLVCLEYSSTGLNVKSKSDFYESTCEKQLHPKQSQFFCTSFNFCDWLKVLFVVVSIYCFKVYFGKKKNQNIQNLYLGNCQVILRKCALVLALKIQSR